MKTQNEKPEEIKGPDIQIIFQDLGKEIKEIRELATLFRLKVNVIDKEEYLKLSGKLTKTIEKTESLFKSLTTEYEKEKQKINETP